MASPVAESQRLLAGQLMTYCSEHPPSRESWPLLFSVALRLYQDSQPASGDMDARRAKTVILTTLDGLARKRKLACDDHVYTLVQDTLKTCAGVLVDMMLAVQKDHRQLSPQAAVVAEYKFQDVQSAAAYAYLLQQKQVSFVSESNWPLLAMTCVTFLQNIVPPLPPNRQRAIAIEVLTAALEACWKHVVSVPETKTSAPKPNAAEKRVRANVEAMVDFCLQLIGQMESRAANVAEGQQNAGGCCQCVVL